MANIKNDQDFELYGLHYHPDEGDPVSFSDVKVLPYLKGFFYETSFQGPAALLRYRGYFKKFLWFIFMAGCIGGLYAEMNIFFNSLTDWDASTAVSIESPRFLYFPAVTICNSNPINGDFYSDYVVAKPTMSYDFVDPTGGFGTLSNVSNATSAVNSTVASVFNNVTSNSSSIPIAGRKKRQVSLGVSVPSTGGSQGALSTSNSPSLDQTYSDMSVVYKYNETFRKANAGHKLCDMVLDCSYNGKSCDNIETAFTNTTWNPIYGNCFTFNLGYTQAASDASVTELWTAKLGSLKDGILKATQIGKSYGLYLLLNVDLSQYLPSTTSAGWRIFVHNQSSYPFPEMNGVSVSPGTSTHIQIKQSYLEKLRTVDNYLYVGNYSQCNQESNWVPDDQRNAYTNELQVLYTKEACLKTCYQRNVMKNCSCYDYKVASVGKAFAEEVPNYASLSFCPYTNDTLWTCKETVWKMFSNGTLTCDCEDPCSKYTYDLSVSSEKWPVPVETNVKEVCTDMIEHLIRVVNTTSTCPGSSKMRDIGESVEELVELQQYCSDYVNETDKYYWYKTAEWTLGKRYAEVYIYYQTFDVQSIVESEAYSFADVIAYLGGIIGLFFGFTMLTLCEYVLLLLDLIGIAIVKMFKKTSLSGGNDMTKVSPEPPGYVEPPLPSARRDIYPSWQENASAHSRKTAAFSQVVMPTSAVGEIPLPLAFDQQHQPPLPIYANNGNIYPPLSR